MSDIIGWLTLATLVCFIAIPIALGLSFALGHRFNLKEEKE